MPRTKSVPVDPLSRGTAVGAVIAMRPTTTDPWRRGVVYAARPDALAVRLPDWSRWFVPLDVEFVRPIHVLCSEAT